MHPRNLHLYFFSPTGGTQHVAGLFAENLIAADACTDITVCAEAKTFSADDCLLVFFPVYGGRVPGPCLERVRARGLKCLNGMRHLPERVVQDLHGPVEKHRLIIAHRHLKHSPVVSFSSCP